MHLVIMLPHNNKQHFDENIKDDNAYSTKQQNEIIQSKIKNVNDENGGHPQQPLTEPLSHKERGMFLYILALQENISFSRNV